MKKLITTIIVIFVIILGILIAGPLYVINEGEQAVIVRLGQISEDRVITNAGLHVKIPFIDEVVRYPKKIMSWNGEPRIVPTAERQFIFVDIVARWRISDPKKFYESIQGGADGALLKLAEIIDSEVRTVIAENPLRESVRNSNIILDRSSDTDILNLDEGIDEEILAAPTQESNIEPIARGRRQLAEEILARSRRMVPEYGIELIDVVTRQIRYSDELTPSVYERMKRERNQIAMYYRSVGEGRKAEWIGRMESELMEIESGAYNQAQTIMGIADAEAARIYANAYDRNQSTRDFYRFWRGMESYRQTMPRFDKTLTTDMEYFRYLYNPNLR
ncbi:MAG: protease modulator HflC [Treponema sp.]|nr:protease modulator HflC [Treponema sp.]